MSEAIFELNSHANIVTQLPKNYFDALTFTSEVNTTSRSCSKTSRLLPANDGP